MTTFAETPHTEEVDPLLAAPRADFEERGYIVQNLYRVGHSICGLLLVPQDARAEEADR